MSTAPQETPDQLGGQLAHAREARGDAYEELQRAQAWLDTVTARSEEDPTPARVDAVVKARASLRPLRADYARADLKVRRLETRLTERLRWAAYLNSVRGRLMAEYYGLGPQYELLVDRAAQAQLRAAQADEQGEDVDAGEHRALAREIRENVQALQRYTESTKQTVIDQQANEKAFGFLQIIEEIVQAEAPDLWRKVTERLLDEVPARDKQAPGLSPSLTNQH